MDCMYVQSIPFHYSISTSYKYRIAKEIRSKKKVSKRDAVRQLKKVVNTYNARGVKLRQINADNEFRVLEDDIGDIQLNIVAAGEHVGNVERSIRTLKEYTRCHVHRLPYKRYPIEMVCGAVRKSIKDINNEVANDGVSDELSPATIIEGIAGPSYKEILKLNFGDYVQAHVPANKTNDNEPRTTGAIALYPSGNAQGSWYFMSLVTGKRIHRYQWTALPISQEVLQRVEDIAIYEQQPLVASNFKYQWNPDGDDEIDGEDSDVDDVLDEPPAPPPPPAVLEIEQGVN